MVHALGYVTVAFILASGSRAAQTQEHEPWDTDFIEHLKVQDGFSSAFSPISLRLLVVPSTALLVTQSMISSWEPRYVTVAFILASGSRAAQTQEHEPWDTDFIEHLKVVL
jgi:hypothetical protein